jgi:hypothetical protein
MALLENAWTNHYNQPPNSTLSGLHMTQTTHDSNFVEWANPLEIHQNGHVVGGNGGLGIFCPKCLRTWLKIFHCTFLKHKGWFCLMVTPTIVHKVNHLTGRLVTIMY